jgi:hypothetical protein
MKRFLALLAATLFVAPACHADKVFNCTTDYGMSFQSMPCMVVAVNELPPSASAESAADEEVVSASPVATPMPGHAAIYAAIHSRHDDLQAGTSDLQVLNNRRWGKPQRITRNREARAWHETWSYDTGANGGKQLHFVNGVLTGIEDLVPPPPAAGIVPVVIIKQ